MTESGIRKNFSAGFYERFYKRASTRAVDQNDIQRLADHIIAYLRYLEIPVRSAIDMGCGIGLWKRALSNCDPGISYRGVDNSRELCREFGWECFSLAEYEPPEKFDLVICQSVLQYLAAKEARRAVKNLYLLCKGAMYLEVVTLEDWENNCDTSRTDGRIYMRSARWYRDLATKYFINCGGGLFLPIDSPAVLYELEHC